MATYDDLRAHVRQPTLQDRVRLFWLESADRLIPRLTQLNVPTSRFLEKRVRSIAPRIPTLVLPPLVDLDLFQSQWAKAQAFRIKWGLGNAVVISYLGTFWSVDGVGNLVMVASQLVASGEQFRLVISGAPDSRLDCDDVPALVQELNLHQIVVQTGWLLTDDVVAGMSAADILVVPKLDDIANVAGVPAKLAEYLAVGRAVVVSRVGDIPLYLTDHEDAILCEPGDLCSLAEALRELIHDASLRSSLAANARLAAEEHFDYRKAVARLESAMVQASSQEREP
jgi:glycosyltransferase involved in cell wall biosynthesis